jgi:hypothetical protein
MPRKRDGRHLITPQSPVQIPTAQLVFTVAKLVYRRVIRKAGVERRRPFRVLSPVVATTSSVVGRLFLGVSCRRATSRVRVRVAPTAQFRPKLSVVSVSRDAWVNGCCFRSIAPNPLGLLSDRSRCDSHPFGLRGVPARYSGRKHPVWAR